MKGAATLHSVPAQTKSKDKGCSRGSAGFTGHRISWKGENESWEYVNAADLRHRLHSLQEGWKKILQMRPFRPGTMISIRKQKAEFVCAVSPSSKDSSPTNSISRYLLNRARSRSN